MISGYAKKGKLTNALYMYKSMIKNEITPNTITYNSLIEAYLSKNNVI